MEITKVTADNGIIIWMVADSIDTDNPVIHKPDGPAVIHRDGSTEWWQWGLLHRKEGPAKEMANGEQQWWINGSRHRLDGPAITKKLQPTVRSWWIEGVRARTWQEYQNLTGCSDEQLNVLILRYGKMP